MKKVILKEGKEKPILARHHWIFSGALKEIPDCEPGQILPVYSNKGDLLGHATFNPKCSLAGRMISFGDGEPLKTLERRFEEAWELRKTLFDDGVTNCFRVVNGEGDAIPGLIVDKYHDVVVVQVGTAGMERLKSFFVELIRKKIPGLAAIYEKSSAPSRKQEGLREEEGFLFGEKNECVVIENGIYFEVNFPESQKTGLFLDHREMRKLIQRYARRRNVLNCFSYTGGFSLYAAKGGAISITSLDISKRALQLASHNFSLNHFPPHTTLQRDIFEFLEVPHLEYDLVICDPPAFAKKKEDLPKAMNGYRELNRLIMEKMPPKSLLLTCSCSYHVDEALFQKILFQAALSAGREAKILSKHLLAPDHPISLHHPESDYLKSFLLSLS